MRRFKRFDDNEEHTDVETADLLGPVKQVMLTTYKAHLRSGEVIQGKIEVDYGSSGKNYITTYNEQGTRIADQRFGQYGNELDTYDNQGRHLQNFNYSKTGELQRTRTYHYDEQGRSIGNVTFNADGSLWSRIVDIYDDRGNKIEHIHSHGEPEKVIAREVSTYDENNHNLSTFKYKADGQLDLTITSTYNENGKRTEYKYQHANKESSKYDQWQTYKYNEHNDCIEMVYYNPDGSMKDIFTHNYEYDANGERIIPSHPHYDPFELAPGETEEIEYDRYENRIKRTSFYNKLPVNIYIWEYVYYDDPVPEELHHPLEDVTNRKEETAKKPSDEDVFTKEDAKWMADMPNFTADNFPAARYYMLRFGDVPSVISYTMPYIEAMALLEELQDSMRAEEIHSSSVVTRNGYGKRKVRYTLSFPGYPYLLQATGISTQDEYDFDLPESISSHHYGVIHTSHFQLFCPSEASNKGDDYFEHEIEEHIAKCTLEKKPDKPVINMIEVSGTSFVMREHPVDDDFEIRDLDVNYGYGFQKFHSELMTRFNTSTKGLVLFHGEPGTGKTYYIRHLLRSMSMNKKIVIYMPPNMVDHLVEPGFMTFLTEEIKSWSEDGNFCVMLIEDAEPLLAKRQEGVRIQGITNLLNMTDGILNDMLNLQVICTFNVGLRKLDSALLRPGRLIARKEFKALSELDANLLAQRIGIKHHFTKPATLGEIYAMKKDQSILIHDVDSDENSSTLIDDLI